ncbi:MAG: tetratricopeptide repeat protein [Gammaproteobacteria bacterium]|nr:tetratricopeptide repeat protein [Gammaproteobacteria bacterium]
MPVLILSWLFQLILVAHCMKTGRDTKWIWLLMIMPGIGGIAYLLIEVLPELLGSRTGQRAKDITRNTINPHQGLKEAADELTRADTVHNRIKLAEECLNREQYAEAKELYKDALKGIHQYDPHILAGLAKAQIELKEYEGVIETLDLAIEKNPEFKHQDSHLLYARSKAAVGDFEAAREEYESLLQYYTGPEPHYRYALLLAENGHDQTSEQLLNDIVEKSKLSPTHYYKQHKHWIDLAKSQLSKKSR